MYRVFNHWVSGRKTLLFVAESAAIAAACATGAVMLARALHPESAGARGPGEHVTGSLLVLLSIGFAALYQAAFYFLDLYDLRVAAEDRSRGARLIRALGLAVFAMAMLLTVLRIRPPEGVVLGGAFGAILGVIFARGLLGNALARPSRLLVVGQGPRAQRLLELLDGAEEATQVAAVVDARRLGPGRENLLEVARRARAEAVVLATDPGQEQASPEDLAKCRYSGVRVYGAAQYCERVLRRIPVRVLDGVQFATADELSQGPLRRASKRAFDLLVATALLVLAGPLVLLLVVLVLLDSEGPAFSRQERVGRNGRPYALWKLRSMRLDAEKNGAVWARAKDDRVTRVGRFIRKTRMDEIPQVLNVLRGDMSFVGPRPERQVFIDIISRDVPYYTLREGVKPGITGWAQIRYPYGASVEDGRNKLEFDLYYVKNGTRFLDLAIIFHTVRNVLLGKGAR
ncbi:MAG TPA: exopolysaccharide biosynthesis polyprenyl glycosylphosphotransferase [Myxococcaceae bacterium]|nr:exopolysaccharide biosynthesis polyprenyl glycosylphosphotransferase [Myxococcaceae bacterium]